MDVGHPCNLGSSFAKNFDNFLAFWSLQRYHVPSVRVPRNDRDILDICTSIFSALDRESIRIKLRFQVEFFQIGGGVDESLGNGGDEHFRKIAAIL